RDLSFRAEDIAVKVRNPLASARRHVEIAYCGLNVRCHAVPVELRVAVDDVGGRCIAKLAVHAYFFKLMIEGIGFPDVVGIAELPDEICRSKDRCLLIILLIFARRKSGALDSMSNALLVELRNALDPLYHVELRSVDMVGHQAGVG